MKFPKKPTTKWSLADVHEHLSFAVNLEMWTIPYYMTTMYSIKDPSEPMFRLLQSIVYQEMLHAQLAANIYNAFQPSTPLALGPYEYTKAGGVPHLDFDQDPDALLKYGEPDAELGGLDLARLGTMCLIELPETEPPPTDPNTTSYATIGDFYDALRVGMRQNADAVVGGNKQLDVFHNFYNDFSPSKVTQDGRDGLAQAMNLVDAITEQGEGRCNANELIPAQYRNTADGYNPSWSHFLKFNAVRDGLLRGQTPPVYEADPTKRDTKHQLILVKNFRVLLDDLEQMFAGEPSPDFGARMPTVGANILTCWRNGVIPQYTISKS